MKDYYQILSVGEDASPKQIKTSYRKLAREFHPDINKDNPSAARRFKEINEAYETLGDANARANYDAGLHGKHYSFEGGFGGVFNHMDEIFGSFFSGRSGRKQKKTNKNLDLTIKIKLAFEEAILGCEKTIRFSRNGTCDDCRGSGASPNSDLTDCHACHGTGVNSHQQGFMFIQVTCNTCGGAGKFITHPCKSCLGNGLISEKKEVSIDVPAGVDENSLLQVRGMGHIEKHTGDTGNLLIQLKIQPSPIFERKEFDISSTVHVPFVTMALGGNWNINTVHGETTVSIKPGTENGHVVKIKDHGVILTNGKMGSHLAKLVVKIPKNMNQKQIEALHSFQKTME